MKLATLIAAGALGLSGLAVAAPAASAAPAGQEVQQVQQVQTVIATQTAQRPDCRGSLGRNFHRTRCHTRAPGNQFRALVQCSNGSWYAGPWRRQTRNFSTTSTAVCPSGLVRVNFGWGFR
jgi:hypothetical protein